VAEAAGNPADEEAGDGRRGNPARARRVRETIGSCAPWPAGNAITRAGRPSCCRWARMRACWRTSRSGVKAASAARSPCPTPRRAAAAGARAARRIARRRTGAAARWPKASSITQSSMSRSSEDGLTFISRAPGDAAACGWPGTNALAPSLRSTRAPGLTSAVVCSARWHIVNTVRWRAGSEFHRLRNLVRAFPGHQPLLGRLLLGHRLGRRDVAGRRHRHGPPQPPRPRFPHGRGTHSPGCA